MKRIKFRYIAIIAGGLFISAVSVFIVQFSNYMQNRQFPNFNETENVANIPKNYSDIGIMPVSFENVTEFTTDTGRKIRFSGRAQPNASLVLHNRGERLRQIKVGETGNWGVTLDVEPQAMAIEAFLYADNDSESLHSDDIIFRIPAPNFIKDRAIGNIDNFANIRALLIQCSPGKASQIIQSPFQDLTHDADFFFDVIDYDDSGGVVFAGRSNLQGRVRLYLGNSAIGETGIAENGRWNFTAAQILPLGQYDVWAEFIGADKARKRIGVVFERLPVIADNTGEDGALSVKFSPNIWQIRRRLIGGGIQTTAIFAPSTAEQEPPAER